MIKLQLGCCDRKIPGFVNVDIRSDQNPDVAYDISKIDEIFNEVDLIYSSHVLEHFKRNEYMNVLKTWFKVLKPGGILRLSVPSLSAIVEYYNKYKTIDRRMLGLLYGDQGSPYSYHYHIWDDESLSKDLRDIGFSIVRKWDWREVDHGNFDDHSQAYLPHMDKKNGILMSCNIEAVK